MGNKSAKIEKSTQSRSKTQNPSITSSTATPITSTSTTSLNSLKYNQTQRPTSTAIHNPTSTSSASSTSLNSLNYNQIKRPTSTSTTSSISSNLLNSSQTQLPTSTASSSSGLINTTSRERIDYNLNQQNQIKEIIATNSYSSSKGTLTKTTPSSLKKNPSFAFSDSANKLNDDLFLKPSTSDTINNRNNEIKSKENENVTTEKTELISSDPFQERIIYGNPIRFNSTKQLKEINEKKIETSTIKEIQEMKKFEDQQVGRVAAKTTTTKEPEIEKPVKDKKTLSPIKLIETLDEQKKKKSAASQVIHSKEEKNLIEFDIKFEDKQQVGNVAAKTTTTKEPVKDKKTISPIKLIETLDEQKKKKSAASQVIHSKEEKKLIEVNEIKFESPTKKENEEKLIKIVEKQIKNVAAAKSIAITKKPGGKAKDDFTDSLDSIFEMYNFSTFEYNNTDKTKFFHNHNNNNNKINIKNILEKTNQQQSKGQDIKISNNQTPKKEKNEIKDDDLLKYIQEVDFYLRNDYLISRKNEILPHLNSLNNKIKDLIKTHNENKAKSIQNTQKKNKILWEKNGGFFHFLKHLPNNQFYCFYCKLEITTLYNAIDHVFSKKHAKLFEISKEEIEKVMDNQFILKKKDTNYYYCLVCEISLLSHTDILWHSYLITHRKLLAEKLKQNINHQEICKFHDNKFHSIENSKCLECNLVLTTENDIVMHILSKNHQKILWEKFSIKYPCVINEFNIFTCLVCNLHYHHFDQIVQHFEQIDHSNFINDFIISKKQKLIEMKKPVPVQGGGGAIPKKPQPQVSLTNNMQKDIDHIIHLIEWNKMHNNALIPDLNSNSPKYICLVCNTGERFEKNDWERHQQKEIHKKKSLGSERESVCTFCKNILFTHEKGLEIHFRKEHKTRLFYDNNQIIATFVD